MIEIGSQVERLAEALKHTSWRCELGQVDPRLLERAESVAGPLPEELRAFVSRVLVLENHAGDVRFVSAQDLADPESDLARTFAEWRHADEETARADARTFGEVKGFWDRVVPFVCSTVNSEDFLALDTGHSPAPVIEAWGEQGWSESGRVCASSFGHFLESMIVVATTGPAAFECGWRLGRRAAHDLHDRDPQYREPLVPVLFIADFDSASPQRRSSRPSMRRFR